MAMDRQSMVDIAGYGYPHRQRVPVGPGQGIRLLGQPGSREKYGKYNKFDLEGAKALLKEAGYKGL